jgi:hypothetical protein
MAAPINPNDTPAERVSKLLPADITAAFLSAKAGLIATFKEPAADQYIFWTFVVILLLSPFYFWFVNNVRSIPQLIFLGLSFVVFSVSIADNQFIGFLTNVSPEINFDTPIRVVSVVLTVLWAFIISQIFVAAFKGKLEST